MKEIWIKSELYIKSYEFSIFRDFFRIFKLFFLFNFRFLTVLINKKIIKIIKKWARGPRGCDVARKAMGQHHADPRSAPTWRVYIYYIFII